MASLLNIEQWQESISEYGNGDDTPLVAQLYEACSGLFSQMLEVLSKQEWTSPPLLRSLERSHNYIVLWADGFGVNDGRLDDSLHKSQRARNLTFRSLLSICRTLNHRLLQLLPDDDQLRLSAKSSDITRLSEKLRYVAMQDISQDADGDTDSDTSSICEDVDFSDIADDLKTDTQCLLDLGSRFDDEIVGPVENETAVSPSVLRTWDPIRNFTDRILWRYPHCEVPLAGQLGKATWDRVLRQQSLKDHPIQSAQSADSKAKTAASTTFRDSGLGSSSPTAAPGLLDSPRYSQSAAPSTCAGTILLYHGGEGGTVRVPSLPEGAQKGMSFSCISCGQTLRISNRSIWKKHLFRDLRPYSCLVGNCPFSSSPFETKMQWVDHLALDHGYSKAWGSVKCPICNAETGHGKANVTSHLSSHLEEISLIILPVNANSEDGTGSEDEGSCSTLTSSDGKHPHGSARIDDFPYIEKITFQPTPHQQQVYNQAREEQVRSGSETSISVDDIQQLPGTRPRSKRTKSGDRHTKLRNSLVEKLGLTCEKHARKGSCDCYDLRNLENGYQDYLKEQLTTLVHELAIEGQSFEHLQSVWLGTDANLRPAIKKVANFVHATQKWSMKEIYWKELDVWKYEYDSPKDREVAIDNAIGQYDKQRVETSDPVWQRLLPKEDRGKGIVLSKLQTTLAKGNITPAPKISVQKPEHASQQSTAAEHPSGVALSAPSEQMAPRDKTHSPPAVLPGIGIGGDISDPTSVPPFSARRSHYSHFDTQHYSIPGIYDEDASNIICALHPSSEAAHAEVQRLASSPGHKHHTTRNFRTGDYVILLKLDSTRQQPKLGFTFGRNPKCDIHLTDPLPDCRISRSHFRIYLDEIGSVMIEDCSTNGTVVNNKLLRQKDQGVSNTCWRLEDGSDVKIILDQKEKDLYFAVEIPYREAEAQKVYMKKAAISWQVKELEGINIVPEPPAPTNLQPKDAGQPTGLPHSSSLPQDMDPLTSYTVHDEDTELGIVAKKPAPAQYQEANAALPPPRQRSYAFNLSANPDEDWTMISDLAERRRISNRIAQRNYRKKLKARLEDLEKRRTGSTDGAWPEPTSKGREASSGDAKNDFSMLTRVSADGDTNSPV